MVKELECIPLPNGKAKPIFEVQADRHSEICQADIEGKAFSNLRPYLSPGIATWCMNSLSTAGPPVPLGNGTSILLLNGFTGVNLAIGYALINEDGYPFWINPYPIITPSADLPLGPLG